MRNPLSVNTLFGVMLLLASNLSHASTLPLVERLGGLAYYDPNLDITWAADAGLKFGNFSEVNAWVDSLTIGGVSGWRLPTADVNGDGTIVDCTGGGVTGCADNEMGYLHWEEGITSLMPGVFTDVGAPGFNTVYWSSTPHASDPVNRAWGFDFDTGTQGWGTISNTGYFAWAVYSGDVANAIPVPAAVWLFGSGLLGLIGLSRRKKA